MKEVDLSKLSEHSRKQIEIGCKILSDYDKGIYKLVNMDQINNRFNKGDLLRFACAMCELGDPQDELKIIHVAGTNGKGSTCNYLASILVEAGYKVGTFTSPAITDVTERIRINFENITSREMTLLAGGYNWNIIDMYHLSTFEIYTLICFLYMKEQKVDYLILETGIGGRLDSTNICKPILTCITNVGMDHTEMLGHTIDDIAREKLGIKKDGVKMIVGNSSSANIIMRNSDGKDIEVAKQYVEGDKWNVSGYQYENANTAVSLAKELNIKDDIILKGIQNAPQWFGRYERFGNIVIDGAHNIDGIKKLLETDEHFDDILFSALKDKDVSGMIKELKEKANVTLCSFECFRPSLDAKTVSNDFNTGYTDNFENFIKQYPSNKKLLITGSLYFISLVRQILTKDGKK